jgi:hypothetical protein
MLLRQVGFVPIPDYPRAMLDDNYSIARPDGRTLDGA